MGVLGALLGLVFSGASIIILTVALTDKAARGGHGLVGKAQRIGTHICYKSDGALTGYFHALIKLLGDGHGAPGRHAQAAGGFLLESRGDKRGRGAAVLLSPFDSADFEGLVRCGGNYAVHLVLGVELLLFALKAVVSGHEGSVLASAVQPRVQKPVFLAFESLDVVFPVHHHAGGHGLDPAGGKAPADLFPQKGRELIAHDAVKHSAGLLGVDKVYVYVPGLLYALGDDFFRYFVEGNTPGLVVRQIQKLLQMP